MNDQSQPGAGDTSPRCACSAADHLDLMRDEFMRIRSCPGGDDEIKGLCDRAISGIQRKVPLIVEAERLQRLNDKRVHDAIMRICPDCGDDMCGDDHRTCFRCAAQVAHDRLCRFTHRPLTVEQNNEINSIINLLKTALYQSSATKPPNKELEDRLTAVRAQQARTRQNLVDLRTAYDAAKAIADAYAPAKDVAAIRARLDELDSLNRKVRENKAYEELNGKLNTARQKAHELDGKLDAIDGEKAKLMASAKFPVPGLSLGDGVVLLNDLPLDQASSAEQLRVSVAIGIAMNPKLRVLLIRDGSLLDSTSKAMIAEMASAAGAQVWIEEVAEPDASGKYPSDISVVIEDGIVKQ